MITATYEAPRRVSALLWCRDRGDIHRGRHRGCGLDPRPLGLESARRQQQRTDVFGLGSLGRPVGAEWPYLVLRGKP